MPHALTALLSSLLMLVPIPAHLLAHAAQAVQLPKPQSTAQVLFVGDMMFDRSVRTKVDEKGGNYIFSCVDPLLYLQDLVVGNLEGPITDEPSVSASSTPGDENNFTFTFPPRTAQLLYDHNIRVVNIGNNHIYNFGVAGVRSTVKYLSDAGVRSFGDPIHASTDDEDVYGVPLAFINYNQFVGTGSASTTLQQIAAARAQGKIPVVFTHWGEEYLPATDREKDLAHRFIDAGAEIVIGTHPHVVQEHEIYKGKYIYYSLGNFIFDQYWDESVSNGLTLEVRFDQNGVTSVKEIPVQLDRDRRTCEVS